jgi:hypothetical protein
VRKLPFPDNHFDFVYETCLCYIPEKDLADALSGITFDNSDIRKATTASLRGQIGVVFQESCCSKARSATISR